jgi:Xaa-Pro aminopeptidase
MAAGRDAARHAGSIYRRAFARLRHPVREIEAEAEHLHQVERAGESAETPAIAIFGIVLFLLPIVLVILGLSFLAYYLAR